MPATKDESGTWSVNLRYTDWQGTSRRKHKRGFRTKREAQDWEREFLHQSAGDLNMTFSSFFEKYKEDRSPRLKEHSWINKEYIVRDKILPYFGDKPMNEIKPRDIVKWQNTLICAEGKNGKPYSETYLKTIQNQLTAILTHATRFYGLKTNPAVQAGSMGKKRAPEMKFWTRDQYELFAMEAMADPAVYYAFEVLYWCGLRVGELLALTYGDIDLERRTMTINKSYQRLKGKDVITDPKTPKSKRVIWLPEPLCVELMEYMAINYGWEPQDRMFEGLSKGHLGRQLKLYAEASGLGAIRVHDLRHSHVSLLIELGYSAVAIGDRLGHDSVEITYMYAHLFPNKQSEMAENLSMLMEGARNELPGGEQPRSQQDGSLPHDGRRAA